MPSDIRRRTMWIPSRLLSVIESRANRSRRPNFTRTVLSLIEDGLAYEELKEDVKSGLAVVLRGTALGQYKRDKSSLERTQIFLEQCSLIDKFAAWWVTEDAAFALDSARRMRGNGMRPSLADAIEEAARRVR